MDGCGGEHTGRRVSRSLPTPPGGVCDLGKRRSVTPVSKPKKTRKKLSQSLSKKSGESSKGMVGRGGADDRDVEGRRESQADRVGTQTKRGTHSDMGAIFINACVGSSDSYMYIILCVAHLKKRRSAHDTHRDGQGRRPAPPQAPWEIQSLTTQGAPATGGGLAGRYTQMRSYLSTLRSCGLGGLLWLWHHLVIGFYCISRRQKRKQYGVSLHIHIEKTIKRRGRKKEKDINHRR